MRLWHRRGHRHQLAAASPPPATAICAPAMPTQRLNFCGSQQHHNQRPARRPAAARHGGSRLREQVGARGLPLLLHLSTCAQHDLAACHHPA